MQPRLFLGIDAGHGHTDAVIGDEQGTVLGRGRGGASGDHPAEPGGRDRVRAALDQAVRQALREAQQGDPAHVAQLTFEAAHCAMTSAHADKRPIVDELISAAHLDVGEGAAAALWGATAGEPGIVVVGGIGAVAYGEAWNGTRAQAGGWGYLFGGEGGGFWLAAEGLRAAAAAQDRVGPATLLLERARQHYQRPSLAQVAGDFYGGRITRDQLATFAERVYACAIEGDVRSKEIVERTGTALAELVWSVRSALPFPTDAMAIATVGGMFNMRIVRDTFWRELQAELPLARLVAPRFDPAIGALIGAYRATGLFTSAVLERLAACCPQPEPQGGPAPAYARTSPGRPASTTND